MLREIDLTKKISRDEFKKQYDALVIEIGELQREARRLKIPVAVVFEGIEGAGKGTLINNLLLPMDSRGVKVELTQAPNEDEKMRPFLWRFWRKTPSTGRIVIFDRSWYSRLVESYIKKKVDKSYLFMSYEEIESFERQLCDDGTVLMKFFLHIGSETQKKRFKKLESGNPLHGV